jgi:hypothetical protein
MIAHISCNECAHIDCWKEYGAYFIDCKKWAMGKRNIEGRLETCCHFEPSDGWYFRKDGRLEDFMAGKTQHL